MSKKPLILGIETSCDETAASVITENDQGKPIILSNIVSSQTDVHKEFGGVVPELAARSHIEKIDLIVKKALDESGIKIKDIDAVDSCKSFRRTCIESKISFKLKLSLPLAFNFGWSFTIFKCSRSWEI